MIKVFEITLLVDLSSSNLFWVVMPLYSVIANFDSLVGIKHRTFTHAIYSQMVASLPLLAFGDLFFVVIFSPRRVNILFFQSHSPTTRRFRKRGDLSGVRSVKFMETSVASKFSKRSTRRGEQLKKCSVASAEPSS